MKLPSSRTDINIIEKLKTLSFGQTIVSTLTNGDRRFITFVSDSDAIDVFMMQRDIKASVELLRGGHALMSEEFAHRVDVHVLLNHPRCE